MPATRTLPSDEFSSCLETYRQRQPLECLFTVSFCIAGNYHSNTPVAPEKALFDYHNLRMNDAINLIITDFKGTELTEQQLSMIAMTMKFSIKSN